MKPALMTLFLPLCLAVAAAAQTPEQEMQAEAQKLIGGFCISPRKGIFPRARVDLSLGRMEL
jgi:hypothetical protein